MSIDIYAGKRVLYKYGNSGWLVGTVQETRAAEVNEQGIWIPIIPKNLEDEIHWAEINNLFLDAIPVDDYCKDYRDIFMAKDDYIDMIEDTDDMTSFKAAERAYVSDGEYYYYPIAKYTRAWLEKQPFDYIVRI